MPSQDAWCLVRSIEAYPAARHQARLCHDRVDRECSYAERNDGHQLFLVRLLSVTQPGYCVDTGLCICFNDNLYRYES